VEAERGCENWLTKDPISQSMVDGSLNLKQSVAFSFQHKEPSASASWTLPLRSSSSSFLLSIKALFRPSPNLCEPYDHSAPSRAFD
jgi:hypothetical protein